MLLALSTIGTIPVIYTYELSMIQISVSFDNKFISCYIFIAKEKSFLQAILMRSLVMISTTGLIALRKMEVNICY